MGERLAIGIDIGGTGTKHALVDLETGALVTERMKQPTPQPATPEALSEIVADAVRLYADRDVAAVGVGFPAVVSRGCALTAVNIAPEWRYMDVEDTFAKAIDRPVAVLNDGDAAGLAEVRYGAGAGVKGKVVVVTLGTGVGTSLFLDGRLVPNMELGRLFVRGKPAGERAANSVRKRKRLSWSAWARDVELFVRELDIACWPELIIMGGGVSKDAHAWLPYITCRPSITPARFRNDAGIVGAALFAAER
ncbi:MAG: ROK family protein [Dehalococcoidia bacterium]|nr:ROK family protein [Dehalococcoidia bacterium]